MKFNDVKYELMKNPNRSLGRLPCWDEGVWIKIVDDASARRSNFRVSIEPFLVISNIIGYGVKVYFPSNEELMSEDWEINHCT